MSDELIDRLTATADLGEKATAFMSDPELVEETLAEIALLREAVARLSRASTLEAALKLILEHACFDDSTAEPCDWKCVAELHKIASDALGKPTDPDERTVVSDGAAVGASPGVPTVGVSGSAGFPNYGECVLCHRPSFLWMAPNPVWREFAEARGFDPHKIACAECFATWAVERGYIVRFDVFMVADIFVTSATAIADDVQRKLAREMRRLVTILLRRFGGLVELTPEEQRALVDDGPIPTLSIETPVRETPRETPGDDEDSRRIQPTTYEPSGKMFLRIDEEGVPEVESVIRLDPDEVRGS